MNKRLRSIFKYLLFFGIGVFLVWWQFHKMTPAEFQKFKYALSDAHYRLVIPVIIMALASHISRAVRWRILIRPLGYNPSLFNIFSSIMAGYLANSFVTRIGEILRCTLLGKYEKIPTEKLLGTIVFERIFDLLCYFIFIGLTILVQFQLVGGFIGDSLHDFFQKNNGLTFLWKVIAFILVITIVVITLRLLLKKNKNSAFITRLRRFFTA